MSVGLIYRFSFILINSELLFQHCSYTTFYKCCFLKVSNVMRQILLFSVIIHNSIIKKKYVKVPTVDLILVNVYF